MYGAQLVWKIDNIQQRRNEVSVVPPPYRFHPDSGEIECPFDHLLASFRELTSRLQDVSVRVSLWRWTMWAESRRGRSLINRYSARGHYFAVYVTILRGEYDALLQWPFVHKVYGRYGRLPSITDLFLSGYGIAHGSGCCGEGSRQHRLRHPTDCRQGEQGNRYFLGYSNLPYPRPSWIVPSVSETRVSAHRRCVYWRLSTATLL